MCEQLPCLTCPHMGYHDIPRQVVALLPNHAVHGLSAVVEALL